MTINSNKNKEVVSKMYQSFLNQKQFELLDNFIDSDYLEFFLNANKPLLNAFPDINFMVKEILADGDKVMTIYEWSGTHQKEYHKIPPTNKKIKVEGISIYEIKNGKIINSIARPNKLSFFLQLGLLPFDFLVKKTKKEEWVYLVDEFEIPKESYPQFKEKLGYNRQFIKELSGYIKDEVIKDDDDSENLTIVTIAIWENKKYLTDAKTSVQEEYRKIGFELNHFNQKLRIKMKRKVFSSLDLKMPTGI